MSRLDVSIVIPVYNDLTGIQTTLESLLTQTTNNQIVVDNDSTDHTPEIVRAYEKDHDHPTLIHEREIQSSYAARNTDIRNTDSEILAFVDADTTVTEDWLDSTLRTRQSTDADYVGCHVEVTLPETPHHPARDPHHTGSPVEQHLESPTSPPHAVCSADETSSNAALGAASDWTEDGEGPRPSTRQRPLCRLRESVPMGTIDLPTGVYEALNVPEDEREDVMRRERSR